MEGDVVPFCVWVAALALSPGVVVALSGGNASLYVAFSCVWAVMWLELSQDPDCALWWRVFRWRPGALAAPPSAWFAAGVALALCVVQGDLACWAGLACSRELWWAWPGIALAAFRNRELALRNSRSSARD